MYGTDNIRDMFKNLSELAYRKQSKEFAEKFNNLYQRNKYIEHVKREKNASVMYNILNATKNIGIFNQLLQEDKYFAFNVLDYSSSQITLFKTLFFKLNQHEGEYIEHIERKKNAGAIYGILNATKNIGIFGQLLQEDKDLAFNALDRINPQTTLFKTLFFKLNQHEGEYIEHIERKKNAGAIYGILNATKNIGIFGQLLQEDKDLAFNVLDRINPQTTLFKTLFFKLNQHEGEYIEHIKREKNAGAIYGILSATKNIGIFGQLLQEDKYFAFNVLDYSSSQITLFKTLFFKLNQHKGKYIEHVERKKNAGAIYGILSATKNIGIFGQLLQEDKYFAFNVLDYSSSQITLFKTLFFKLNQHKGKYIEHVERKKNAGAMYSILNAMKDAKIFGQLLQEDKDFAFNVLDCASPRATLLFKTLFFKLNQHKGKYMEHVERKKNASAMYNILNAMKDAKIFGQLLQEDKDFAFNVLDCASPRATLLFKTLFFKLDQHEGEYIEHVKRKKNASAMCNILNTMEDAEIFGQLLQENKDFAFNVLDRFNSQTTLFKTLFSQLDVKQQEDYKTHLKKRKTATAKYILENFYTTIKTAESTISSEIEGLSHINGALTETAGSTVSSKEDVFTYGDYVFTYGEMVEFIEKLSHNGTSLKDPLTSEDMEELRQAVSNVLNSREQDDGSSQSNSNSSESNIVSFAKESELDKLASNKRKRDDLLDCGEALPNSFDGNQRPAKCQCTLSCEDILELPDELLCLTTVEQWENESLQVRKW